MSKATAAKEHPILFSGPMVRALLDGTKTQTRRIITARNSTVLGHPGCQLWDHLHFDYQNPEYKLETFVDCGSTIFGCGPKVEYLHVPAWHPKDGADLSGPMMYRVRPVYDIGDVLWARETWCECDGELFYRATDPEYQDNGGVPWRPSIFMPRVACRIKLEITSIRAQQVQSISEDDAKAEGAAMEFRTVVPMNGKPEGCTKSYSIPVSYRGGFANLWGKINGNWDLNPWTWVYDFKRL